MSLKCSVEKLRYSSGEEFNDAMHSRFGYPAPNFIPKKPFPTREDINYLEKLKLKSKMADMVGDSGYPNTWIGNLESKQFKKISPAFLTH